MILYDLYELNDDHNIGCWKNKIVIFILLYGFV